MARGVRHLRAFRMGEGLPNATLLAVEIQDMVDVLHGREESPYPEDRVESLAEVAGAYYSRAQEMNIQILKGEREGHILPSSGLSKFRKGELRAFIELSKLTYELGSRRITVANME